MFEITPYHARIFAHELTLAGRTGELDTLGQALFDAQVDLNPHQIEAAVFALAHPAQRGVILADEVGLGKTIEAGLVLAQYWAARKRKLCVVCPAHLRVQWSLELSEKFHLPCRVVDAKAFGELKRKGNPFDMGEVVIISYSYSASMADDLRVVDFDLVVMDEAHKLRNAYKQTTRRGMSAVRHAFEPRRKLLLTATPIQNTLLELYGLAWVMDPLLFGSLTEFKNAYGGQPPSAAAVDDLKARLAPVCQRTLRSQVQAFVRYTKRLALAQTFNSTTTEQELHEGVMAYWRRDEAYGLPRRNRAMMGMILCHMLASSPEALVGTLTTIKARVEAIRDGIGAPSNEKLTADLRLDSDLDEEELAEWFEDEAGDAALEKLDGRAIAAEIAELESLIQKAAGIRCSSKTQALLSALNLGFRRMEEMGAHRKALIFTESRRTQAMLSRFLEDNGYAGKVVCFNGDNVGPAADHILEKWRAKRAGDDAVTGSRAVDIRSAIVAHFKDEAEILIATEAGAEGVNLQFCSLVVNFDLPWNPQRIEQRIGRCHRYGQKYDVVVMNFLNRDNLAERRIHDLLARKFSLFDGLFGSSDEVIGAIEGGLDFEKRILAILQSCRHPADIERAFDALQQEMETIIQARLAKAKSQLLEHFDGEVHERLNLRQNEAKDILDRMSRKFWRLTRWGLADTPCRWNEEAHTFDLDSAPAQGIPTGHYRLRSIEEKSLHEAAHLHRLQAPLGDWLTNRAKCGTLPCTRLLFDLGAAETRISALEPEHGRSGRLRAELLEIRSDATEQLLLVSAVRDDGTSLEPEVAAKLFELPAATDSSVAESAGLADRLNLAAERLRAASLSKSAESGNARFRAARTGLQRWADEAVNGAERDLQEIKDAITAHERAADLALTLEAQEEHQRKLRELERRRSRARAALYDLEDEVKAKRDDLIARLKTQLTQRTQSHLLFEIDWAIA